MKGKLLTLEREGEMCYTIRSEDNIILNFLQLNVIIGRDLFEWGGGGNKVS